MLKSVALTCVTTSDIQHLSWTFRAQEEKLWRILREAKCRKKTEHLTLLFYFKCQKAFVVLSVFFSVGSGSKRLFLWQRLPWFKARLLLPGEKKNCLKEQSVRFASAQDKKSH